MSNRVPVNICGPAYKHTIQEVSNQRCVNMYLSYPNAYSDVDKNNPLEQGRGNGVLIPTMGNLLLTTPSVTGNCRGVFTVYLNWNNAYTFWVMGNRVIQQNVGINPPSFATYTLTGTLPDSSGNVVMTAGPQYLMITKSDETGSSKWAYYYDYTVAVGTGTVTQITDGDFVGGSHVVMVDGYFIVNKPNSAVMQSSDVNTPIAWTATNIATTNGYPDNLVGLGQTKNEIWAFGANSIEVWYDAANSPGFPFSKRVGSDMGIGCAAPYSIITANDKIYWIDSRRYIAQSDFSTFFRNQSSGYQVAKISTEAIDVALMSYSIINDAVASTYIDNGHSMIEWTFPTARKTWVFDTTTGLWHEKASFTAANLLTNSPINFYTTVGNTTYGGSLADHTIYILNRTHITDNGTVIPRIRTTQILSDNFNEITVNELEIKCQTGQASITTKYVPINLLTTTVTGYLYNPVSNAIQFIYFAGPIQDHTTQAKLDSNNDSLTINLTFDSQGLKNLPPRGDTKTLWNPSTVGWLSVTDLVALGFVLTGTGNDNGIFVGNSWLLSVINDPPSVGDVVYLNSYTTVSASSQPKLCLRYSNDSGYNWSNSMPRSLGNRGERNKRLIWGPLGSAREWIIELTMTEASDFAIIDAAAIIDVEQT